MSRPPQPAPYPGDPVEPTTATEAKFERIYRDSLGRPLSGNVVFEPLERVDDGWMVTGAQPVTVPIVDGWVEVTLPSGSYRVTERTTSVESSIRRDTYDLTLPETS